MAVARRPGAGTNQEAVRRHNLGTVLAHLHRDGQLSRADLTARLGLNRSTIGALVGELVSLGLVVETAPSGGRGGAGRPSLDVRPNPHAAVVVGVEVGVDVLSGALVGLGGQVLVRASTPTPASRRPDLVAGAVVRLARRLVAGAPEAAVLLGLGVGVPGVVREPGGVVRFAPNLGWVDVPLADLLRSRMGADLRVTVGNDADLGALAEHTRGAAVGCDDIVFLAADAGVGGGVIVGGHPLHGVGGYAGELGHLMVNPRGRTCRCGSRGCWETEIGAEAIGAALRLESTDLDSLAGRLRQVHRPSAALRSVGRYLGLGLGCIVNVLNPEVVVLGGVLRTLYPVVSADVDQALASVALQAPREQVRVLVPALGGDSVLLGAAEKAFEPVLTDPARELGAACRDAAAAFAVVGRGHAVPA
ncbi:MAG: ROK family transcriptional regulator [Rhodoferax sp.]|nr:ROK family transcriptional regulator [Actinomycetota bacterium]